MTRDRLNNALLRHLSTAAPDVFARLRDDLEPVSLQTWATLCKAHERPRWAYFLDSGVVSLVGATVDGQSIEVAFVGNEGVAGVADILGGRSMPFTLIVQLPGLAYRIPSDVARQHIFSCTALHALLMAHAQSMILQLTQSAICSRFHTAVERLARWLFLTSDRANTDQFELTHEFLAQMVGAPRTAVTQAAAILRDRGVIDYERGTVTVRNRGRLKKMACECVDVLSAAVRTEGAPSLTFSRTRQSPRKRGGKKSK